MSTEGLHLSLLPTQSLRLHLAGSTQGQTLQHCALLEWAVLRGLLKQVRLGPSGVFRQVREWGG